MPASQRPPHFDDSDDIDDLAAYRHAKAQDDGTRIGLEELMAQIEPEPASDSDNLES